MASSSILVNKDVWDVLAKINQEELSGVQLQPQQVGDFLKIHIKGNTIPNFSECILRENLIKTYDHFRLQWKIITFKSKEQITLYLKHATERVKGIVAKEKFKSSANGVVIRCDDTQITVCVQDCSVVDELEKLAIQMQETSLSNEQSSSAEDRTSEVSRATAQVNSVNNNGSSQRNVLGRRASHPNTSLGNSNSMTRRNSQDPQESGNKETNSDIAEQKKQTGGSWEQVKTPPTKKKQTGGSWEQVKTPTTNDSTTVQRTNTAAVGRDNETNINASCSNASRNSKDKTTGSIEKQRMFPKRGNEGRKIEGSRIDNQQTREPADHADEAKTRTQPDNKNGQHSLQVNSQSNPIENKNTENKYEKL